MPGWQRGLVQWLVLPERGVTRRGGGDCGTAAVPLASLNPGCGRGKVVGKEGRAAQAAGLEAALGPPRPTWMAASTHKTAAGMPALQRVPKVLGGLPQAMKHVGVRVYARDKAAEGWRSPDHSLLPSVSLGAPCCTHQHGVVPLPR